MLLPQVLKNLKWQLFNLQWFFLEGFSLSYTFCNMFCTAAIVLHTSPGYRS